jgi:hypothetical protein
MRFAEMPVGRKRKMSPDSTARRVAGNGQIRNPKSR